MSEFRYLRYHTMYDSVLRRCRIPKEKTMADTTRVSFVTETSKRARLAQIAALFGMNLSTVINEALDQYIGLHEWQLKYLREGVEAAASIGDVFICPRRQEVNAFFSQYGQPS